MGYPCSSSPTNRTWHQELRLEKSKKLLVWECCPHPVHGLSWLVLEQWAQVWTRELSGSWTECRRSRGRPREPREPSVWLGLEELAVPAQINQTLQYLVA